MSPTKTVLLTGATGFLGSHLLEALIERNYHVMAMKRSTSNLWRVGGLLEKAQWINVDEQSLEDAFGHRPIDAVIHTACDYGRGGRPASAVVETNVLFSLRLLEAAVKFKTSFFFNTDTFFNTGGTVQSYMNDYTLSKKHFIDWLQVFSYGIRVRNLKLQHVYGPRDDEGKFAAWLLHKMQTDADSIPLTSGEQRRDFVYVDDVVGACLALLEIPDGGSFTQYDVGSGQLNTVRAFAETMKSELEIQIGKKITPRLGFGEVPQKKDEIRVSAVNLEALMSIGWKPRYNLSEGLSKTIRESRERVNKR